MTITANILGRFVPFNSLPQQTLEQLAASAETIAYTPSQIIFLQGKTDKRLYFLLEGEVALQRDRHSARYLRAASKKARHPLDRSNPHGVTATAVTNVRLLGIDESLVERRLSQNQAASYEMLEYSGDGDPQWMIDIVAQPAFQDIPTAHINALFARFEPVRHKAGDVVIRQGEIGDYYYMIREGQARVAHAEPGREPVVLAEISRGEGFGEEALLSGLPRNATVTMMTDGVLMRLGKQDFDALLKVPLLLRVDRMEAKHLVAAGGKLVDVRLEDEYQSGTIKDSINLPLYLLRVRAPALKTRKKYILFCQHEERSSIAAFLLAQRGFDVYVLKGGLAAVPSEERVIP
jgi:CRP-like cAMP-binding protein